MSKEIKTGVCYFGNCLDVLPTLPDNCVDSICCDPPYELGFMGKSWDNSGIAYSVPMWKECLRVLKPGGHLLSFSGTRTYHRMAVAIEDAGFEVRDMIEWVYASGFPKSLNVYKQLTKKYGEPKAKYSLRLMSETDISQTVNNEEKQGEVLLSQLSEQGLPKQQSVSTENVWEGQSSVEGGSIIEANSRELSRCEICQMSERVSENGEERWLCYGTPFGDGKTSKCDINKDRSCPSYRPQPSEQQNRQFNAISNKPSPQDIRRTRGVGTALKPAHEPICLARKPLAEKTVAENVLKYGTGGINIDESRVGMSQDDINMLEKKSSKEFVGIKPFGNTDIKGSALKPNNLGRFPANLIHDNSEEVRECFPNSKGFYRPNCKDKNYNQSSNLKMGGGSVSAQYNDSGNASRFFKSILYYPKASKSERNKDTNTFLTIEICVDNMEVAQLQPKVILEKTELWFTELFGKEKMEEYQMGFKSTIKTETKKTTILITLNYSQHLNIKEYIVDVIKMKMENGGSLVASVVNTSEWKAIITNELMVSLLGVNPVVLPTQLRISINANNFHSTVKPTALMSYLIKMITPKGGIVLEPFAGSGSTLVAAKDNGFQYIGIEMTEEYLPIIQARTGCEIIKQERFYSTIGIDNSIKQQEEDNIKLNKEIDIYNEIHILGKCPQCGGKIKGKYCEDCFYEV